jgi:transcriptional regulator with XRE-family HTH domain
LTERSIVSEGGILLSSAEHLHELRSARGPAALDRRTERALARVAADIALQVREERRRRGLTLRGVAGRASLSVGTVHAIESGRICGFSTYVRLAEALRLRAELRFVDPRRRDGAAQRQADPVHAAIGEIEAEHLRALGFRVSLDEPYQHYQFAGRADVVAWSTEAQALLHIENRTQFPDVQQAFGAFNAKRRYLGADLAAAAGVATWRSETHVMVCLWSAEVLRVVRAHAASFAGVCPDEPGGFDAWWSGRPPKAGRRSILIVFDPLTGRRTDRRRWVGLSEVATVRPRYRDYADATARLRGPAG